MWWGLLTLVNVQLVGNLVSLLGLDEVNDLLLGHGHVHVQDLHHQENRCHVSFCQDYSVQEQALIHNAIPLEHIDKLRVSCFTHSTISRPMLGNIAHQRLI